MDSESKRLEEFLMKITGGNKEIVQKYLNPVKSDYRKNMESKGWEYIGNIGFSPRLDKADGLEALYGEGDLDFEPTLREKMRMKREWLRKDYSADKVRLMRAFDIYGNRVASEELCVAVYVKRKLN